MAASLIGGLIANQHDAALITACDINADQLQQLHELYRIETSQDALAVAHTAEVVMLAVKPQVMREVCTTLSDLPPNPPGNYLSVSPRAYPWMQSTTGWEAEEQSYAACPTLLPCCNLALPASRLTRGLTMPSGNLPNILCKRSASASGSMRSPTLTR